MSRQRMPEGPPATPPVQKLRIHYARRGRLRFSSTRDFQRALERALRRTAVPMAFSSGFHPHPKISYAGAAPTGCISEAEYVEISVVERVEPAAVARALDAALPDGLDIVRCVEARPGSLADRLQASIWQVDWRGVELDEVAAAVDVFAAREQVEVTRVTKSGPRTFDVRAAVLSHRVEAAPSPRCAILHMVVRHTTPTVRPDDILSALSEVAGLRPCTPPLVTRTAQGPLLMDPPRVGDPLGDDESSPVRVEG